jgi:hypothetical protein
MLPTISVQSPTVIVSGLPRSGTSLMMQMLSAGGIPALVDENRPADEDNRLGYFEFEAVKRTKTDPSWLEHSAGKTVKIVYLLLYDLPSTVQYRVVFMRRKLEEVLASQKTMLQRNGKQTGVDDVTMMRVFHKELAKVEAWLKSQANFRVFFADYNRLIADPLAVAAAVNEFLGGQLDVQAMAAAVDPAQYRNRQ